MNTHHSHIPSDYMDLLIETINESDSIPWKADTCKHQKHHAKYGAHCDKELNLAQIDSNDEDDDVKAASEGQETASLAQKEKTEKAPSGPKTFGQGPDFQKALA